jgi:hypothetical protein
MRCIEFLRLFFSEFQISELEFGFTNFSTAEFKKNLTGIFGIKNRIGIPLPMGVSEIGTKNWNSQPRLEEINHITTMAAAAKNCPLLPHMSSNFGSISIGLIGYDGPSKQICLFFAMNRSMALKMLRW